MIVGDGRWVVGSPQVGQLNGEGGFRILGALREPDHRKQNEHLRGERMEIVDCLQT
jgi:hypothetical protein